MHVGKYKGRYWFVEYGWFSVTLWDYNEGVLYSMKIPKSELINIEYEE